MVAGVVGWLAHGLVDFGSHVPGVALPAFVWLGLLGRESPAGATGERRSWRWVPLLAMVAVGVFWSGRLLVAAARATRTDWVGAVRLMPRDAFLWSELGREAMRQGEAETAVVAFQQATRWERYRAAYYWELAQGLLARDGAVTPAVVAALREAARLYPGKPAYRQSLGEAEKILRQSGRASGNVPDNDGEGR